MAETLNATGFEENVVSQICEWIDACDSAHHTVCVPPPISEWPREDVPLWVIDVEQQCIVPGVSAHRYLALSYVWPENRTASGVAPRTLLFELQNLEAFQRPGFLSEAGILQTIPGVIRHAMCLTTAFGERYLWVDRLCILQNHEETTSEVSKMDRVYAGSYLTIVAAAPDEYYEDGRTFPGTKSTDESRKPVGLNGRSILRIMDEQYTKLRKTRWATRGWTFQEHILCKRAVFFTEDGIFWDCQCAMWISNVLIPGQDFENVPLHSDMGKRFSTRWWPDFGFYVDLICPYNGRAFSYPQDALSGISGVLHALTRSFPGGFISGMPALYLDPVLIWQPFGVAERRYDRLEQDGTATRVSSLPSWAWCGWQCFIDPWSLVSGLSAYDDPVRKARAASWSTKNLVEWRISGVSDDPEGTCPRSVGEPGYLKRYTKSCHSPEASPPEGWMRHGTVPRTTKFTHIRDTSVQFNHPIPIQIEESRRPALCTASHLVFSTTTASFLAASILRANGEDTAVAFGEVKISVFEDEMFGLGPSKDKSCPILVLQQPNGALAGLLRMMNNDSINPNKPFELVAISSGSAKADTLKWSLEWQVYSRRQYDYIWRIYWHMVFYGSPLLTQQRQYALLCDLRLAFDRAVTADNIIESRLEAVLKDVNGRVDSAMHHMKQALESKTEMERKGYRHSLWLRERDKVLEERSRNGHSPFGNDENATCEWYNVLWIERGGGVAYRRACGWVPKHIWEAHAKGPVEVTLG